jgi:hypothetical protein
MASMAWGSLFLSPPCARGEQASAAVLEHQGRWESGYGATFYNVVGKVKNGGPGPVAYVKLRVEALDDAGKVVATADAYNESAEALSAPGAAVEALRASGKIKALPAGAEERFRASFLKEDAPTLSRYRVTVAEAPPAK